MTDNNQQPPAQPTTPPATPPAQNGDPAWTKDRTEQAKRAGQRALLETLGFEVPKGADAAAIQAMVDSLKGTLGEHKTLKEAQLNDAQKAQAALNDALQKAKDAEERAARLEQERITDKVNGAITAAAQSAHAEHPQDVVDLLRKGDLDGVLDDKGNVNADKVKALVEAARKERPSWFQTGGVGSPSNRSGTAPETLAAEKQNAIRQLQANLRNKF